MKILQINGYESPGRRFHGLSITPILKKYGIESKHLVWAKDTQDPEVLTFEGIIPRKINQILQLIEKQTSLQSILYRNVPKIIKMPAFQEADLIHLHIIHSGYFSISDLSMITDLKPTIWTLHDPWAMTGHCIHPFECKRWMIGCGECPDLTIPFPLKKDNTKLLFDYKRQAYKNAKFELVVASKWMYDMVKLSPLFEEVSVHQIPFGLDLKFFSPDAAPKARKQFGISEDMLVICFRSDDNPFKGLQHIIQALEKIETKQLVCLLTLGSNYNLLKKFENRFKIINLGWINNEETIRNALVASDIFLMPSIAESFGMMAVEALACSKPVIVFDKTALPEVVYAPEVGVSVPLNDSEALYQALQNLIDNPNERAERGKKGREIAELYYNEETQAKHLAELYKNIVNK
ncbi:MAG: glycosyltransferase family 4 protein [Rickettsia endosymbiont of Ecitomorpha arachnoides]|nr:glycosyltransferase family 4 protein [Rickettsia endosymbiont of Sceptobius lativentris]MCC8462156.1 glycosyltransferase family 4 protein [Rickettsia endosymbiont of Ecitomorpha arachnoides]